MEGHKRIQVRTHVIEVEPPDLMIIRVTGDVTVEDIQGFSEVTGEHSGGWPYILFITDNTRLTKMTAEARKAAMTMSETGPTIRGFAIIGVGAMATISAMLLKMIGLVRRLDCPTVMHKSEAEARDWIARRRAELVAQVA